jgi:FixJ family two-component response regulator
MGNLLQAVGYRVELFPGGPPFLSADPARFSCVISDMQMPEMSGLALQERLREVAPALPIIFLTAFSDAWARSRALAGGACAFFEKPCDLDALIDRLEAVIGPPPPRS